MGSPIATATKSPATIIITANSIPTTNMFRIAAHFGNAIIESES
jgi:hypothetical protein